MAQQNDSMTSVFKMLFSDISGRGGCALMLAGLCAFLVFKDVRQDEIDEARHDRQHKMNLEVVGELRQIKGILLMEQKDKKYGYSKQAGDET